MAKFGFDVAEVDMSSVPSGGNREPVPAGDYALKALEADEKETASGGTMIKAKFEVLKGEHVGRWIWQNFNVVNKSEIAQRIARQQLVGWATACGRADCDDTDKLIDKPFMATVGIDPAKGGYAASNKIVAFLSDKTDTPSAKPAAKATPAAAKAAPAAAKAANPWD
jgi:hypothetical protein